VHRLTTPAARSAIFLCLFFAAQTDAAVWRGSLEVGYQTQPEDVGPRLHFWREFLQVSVEDRLLVRNNLRLSLRLENRSFGNRQPSQFRPRLDLEMGGLGYAFRFFYAPFTLKLVGAPEQRERRYSAGLAVFPHRWPRLSLSWDGLRRVIGEVELHTDEHPLYHSLIAAASIEHLHHLRTNSQLARNHANPLFAVNYFERLVRKDMVNHRRKSICFARDDRNMLSRFAWYMCAHNYFKPKRISSRAKQTEQRHYSHIIDESAELKRWKPMIFDKRLLLSFSAVRGFDREVWLKQVASPLGERGRWNYLLKFASG